MCGRARQSRSLQELAAIFGTTNPLPNMPARWNAAPTQQLAVVRHNPDSGRNLDLLRWGLVPIWAKDLRIGNQCINGRSETIEAKPAFRNAFKARRCLVPFDSFYEWSKRPDGTKQPYAIGPADDGVLAVAGVWENWKDPTSQEWIRTFAVLTTGPNELMRPIHDRMPVILDPADWPAWLGEGQADREQLVAMLKPYPAERMRAWPVSSRVGNVRNNDASLIDPIAA